MFAETDDGCRIHYEMLSGHRPVLLVHGFATDARATWEASGWLRALSTAGRGAILVDLRGHGESSAPTSPDAYSPVLLARDLGCVLNAIGAEAVDAVGYSMGAQVLRQFAADSPRRLSAVVLGGIGSVEQFSSWGVSTVEAAVLHGQESTDATLDGLAAAARLLPEARRRALVACATGMARHPVTATSNVPTLVVAGDADTVADHAETFAERLGAGFVSIPGRHHGSTLSARLFKSSALTFFSER